MKIFYFSFEITPTIENEYYDVIKEGIALCCIAENNPYSAYSKGKFFTEKANWKIKNIETQPIEVTEEYFLEKEEGLRQYYKAQKEKSLLVISCGQEMKHLYLSQRCYLLNPLINST